MSFSIGTEKENKLSCLDIEIIREQGQFTTTVYRNLLLVTHIVTFKVFLPLAYRFCMVYTLVYRCFCNLLKLDTIPNRINFSERGIVKECLP